MTCDSANPCCLTVSKICGSKANTSLYTFVLVIDLEAATAVVITHSPGFETSVEPNSKRNVKKLKKL